MGAQPAISFESRRILAAVILAVFAGFAVSFAQCGPVPLLMTQSTRYPGLTLRVLGRQFPTMGPGKAALIEAIDRSGSISGAARELEMSYRRAWQLVEAINSSFAEPLIVTATGGKRGGGAVVSELGREVVKRFREMEIKASHAIAAEIAEFSSLLKPARRSLKRR